MKTVFTCANLLHSSTANIILHAQEKSKVVDQICQSNGQIHRIVLGLISVNVLLFGLKSRGWRPREENSSEQKGVPLPRPVSYGREAADQSSGGYSHGGNNTGICWAAVESDCPGAR